MSIENFTEAMMSIEDASEAAWGVKRFLVGADGKPGAQQAVAWGRQENKNILSLHGDFKAKLDAAVRAAAALLTSAETTTSSITQAHDYAGRAQELGNSTFDTQNAANLRAALGASEASTRTATDLSTATTQELREKLAPFFGACNDVRGLVAPGISDGQFEQADGAVLHAHRAMVEYEKHL